MMKQVLVDMDGVLADVYSQFSRLELGETGTVIDIESLYGKLESEAFPNYEKHVRSTNFFRTAPVIPDSVGGLKYLNEKYNVLIVSSATEFPDSLKEKVEWLNEHFPFIKWQQIILCGTKNSIKGDIMIDDHPKNLDYFEGKKILFSQPHNMYMVKDDCTRVNTWQDIINIL
ncbi:MAG: 5'(3')-deoxyribonucleotidase [Prevotella sp.]|jgi:5'(3')-deoxyribonucleotidase|nr:5'(3')-deoxyribonucleotidase [Prevotella sp.]